MGSCLVENGKIPVDILAIDIAQVVEINFRFGIHFNLGYVLAKMCPVARDNICTLRFIGEVLRFERIVLKVVETRVIPSIILLNAHRARQPIATNKKFSR